MADLLEEHFRGNGLPEPRRTAEEALLALAWYFGGRNWYLPRGDRIRRAFRDREIAREFDGANVRALAEKHGLTEIRIYEILRAERAEGRRSRGDL